MNDTHSLTVKTIKNAEYMSCFTGTVEPSNMNIWLTDKTLPSLETRRVKRWDVCRPFFLRRDFYPWWFPTSTIFPPSFLFLHVEMQSNKSFFGLIRERIWFDIFRASKGHGFSLTHLYPASPTISLFYLLQNNRSWWVSTATASLNRPQGAGKPVCSFQMSRASNFPKQSSCSVALKTTPSLGSTFPCLEAQRSSR